MIRFIRPQVHLYFSQHDNHFYTRKKFARLKYVDMVSIFLEIVWRCLTLNNGSIGDSSLTVGDVYMASQSLMRVD